MWYQEDKCENKKNLNLGLVGLLVGGLTFAGLIQYSSTLQEKSIKQGNISPSKIEVQCKDLDGNSELETTLKIEGKPYLLRKVNGEYTLSTYHVESERIIINSITNKR